MFRSRKPLLGGSLSVGPELEGLDVPAEREELGDVSQQKAPF